MHVRCVTAGGLLIGLEGKPLTAVAPWISHSNEIRYNISEVAELRNKVSSNMTFLTTGQ